MHLKSLAGIFTLLVLMLAATPANAILRVSAGAFSDNGGYEGTNKGHFNITGCNNDTIGIDVPGFYYFNSSFALTTDVYAWRQAVNVLPRACITIMTSNVSLSCTPDPIYDVGAGGISRLQYFQIISLANYTTTGVAGINFTPANNAERFQNITIQNCTIAGWNASSTAAGILVNAQVNNLTIANVTFINNTVGLNVTGGNVTAVGPVNLTVKNSSFSNNSLYHIVINISSAPSSLTFFNDTNIIVNNFTNGNYSGTYGYFIAAIFLANGSNSTIYLNNFSNLTNGIIGWNLTRFNITNNNFTIINKTAIGLYGSVNGFNSTSNASVNWILNLTGVGGAWGETAGIRVNTSNNTLSYNTINVSNHSGINITAGANFTNVSHNLVINVTSAGISLWDVVGANLSNNSISNISAVGDPSVATSPRGYGIWIHRSNFTHVVYNRINWTNMSILVNFTNTTNVTNNTLNYTWNGSGVYVLGSSSYPTTNITIDRNTLGNTTGYASLLEYPAAIMVNGTDNVSITNNLIVATTTAHGVVLLNSFWSNVSNNDFRFIALGDATTPYRAINASGVDQLRVIRNDIRDEGWDGIFVNGSNNSRIFNNTIENTTRYGLYLVNVTASDVISNFFTQGFMYIVGALDQAGIYYVNGSNSSIYSNNFSNITNGIVAYNVTGFNISVNNLTIINKTGIALYGSANNYNGTNNVSNNTIFNVSNIGGPWGAACGVCVNTSNNTIIFNVINITNHSGVNVTLGANFTNVSRNTILNVTSAGVSVWDSAGSNVSGNTIWNVSTAGANGAPGSAAALARRGYGVWIHRSNFTHVLYNTIRFTNSSIVVNFTNTTNVTNNTLNYTWNGSAVYVIGSSSYPTTNVTVRYNVIGNTTVSPSLVQRWGVIYALGVGSVNIANNFIVNATGADAITVANATFINVSHNDIRHINVTYHSINLSAVDNASVIRNDIGTESSLDGIVLNGSSSPNIFYNTILAVNRDALVLYNVTGANVSENNLSLSNGSGLRAGLLIGDASHQVNNSLFQNNNFTGNNIGLNLTQIIGSRFENTRIWNNTAAQQRFGNANLTHYNVSVNVTNASVQTALTYYNVSYISLVNVTVIDADGIVVEGATVDFLTVLEQAIYSNSTNLNGNVTVNLTAMNQTGISATLTTGNFSGITIKAASDSKSGSGAISDFGVGQYDTIKTVRITVTRGSTSSGGGGGGGAPAANVTTNASTTTGGEAAGGTTGAGEGGAAGEAGGAGAAGGAAGQPPTTQPTAGQAQPINPALLVVVLVIVVIIAVVVARSKRMF